MDINAVFFFYFCTVNNTIKTTIRTGYGYRNLDNLIGLVMPECGRLNLRLPGRR